jgi:hypothetical protein
MDTGCTERLIALIRIYKSKHTHKNCIHFIIIAIVVRNTLAFARGNHVMIYMNLSLGWCFTNSFPKLCEFPGFKAGSDCRRKFPS